jgi:hypothetical protein
MPKPGQLDISRSGNLSPARSTPRRLALVYAELFLICGPWWQFARRPDWLID